MTISAEEIREFLVDALEEEFEVSVEIQGKRLVVSTPDEKLIILVTPAKI